MERGGGHVSGSQGTGLERQRHLRGALLLCCLGSGSGDSRLIMMIYKLVFILPLAVDLVPTLG